MTGHLHRRTFQIAMSDVDVAQIHFTALHRWVDQGLSIWLTEIGHPFTLLLAEGPGVPIVNITTRISGRMLLDDHITQTTWIGGIGRTSFRSRHRFMRADDVMAETELVHVCLDRETRVPSPVPAWLREQARDETVDV